jgi:transcriptional regulator with XRE-family HTH domain
MDNGFAQRLEKACERAGVPYRQSAIGKLLELNRQTVDTWMNGSLPRADVLYRLADALKVDARWLATGHGDMVEKPELKGNGDISDLVDRYVASSPRWQLSLRLLSHVATQPKLEADGDVNAIIARVFGKSPKEIKYVPNKRVEETYGFPTKVSAKTHNGGPYTKRTRKVAR